jgi:hypothetical protein
MAKSDDIWPLAIALGVGVLLIKNWGQPVIDWVNIGPETKEFTEGVFKIDRSTYAEDQTGSPNPPPRSWWEAPEEDDQLPIPTTIVPAPGLGGSWAVPTPPIMENVPDPRSPARVAGQATNDWFTNPWLYGWFAGAEKILEEASDKTNRDRFWDEG